MDLAHAEAPVRAAHRMVGVDAVAIRPYVVDVVGACGGEAARLYDVDAIFCIGAAIPDKFVLHRVDAAVLLDAGLDLAMEALAYVGILEFVLPAVLELHRPALAAHGQGDDDALDGGACF